MRAGGCPCRVAFGLTCKTFLEAVTMATSPEWKKVALKTDLTDDKFFQQMPCFSMDWFQCVFHFFKRWNGANWRSGKYYDHLYDSDLMYLAAFQGSKKVMEWLVSQGISLDIWRYYHGVVAAAGAAGGGHLHVLEWLRSEGCGFDERTYVGAARGGHLHVLKWLRSQDPPCDWNKWTCSYAAIGGHLDVLQWARSQDPPCDWTPEDCRRQAQMFKHHDIVE
ncbi:hypothetical protein HOP50_01g07870 [Chloropicon primus]|uniref:Uncharacterized protein n=1 Tax=Chloropicon primus TaxID=1764295 RepID=A0A5B8MG30_9CHLO|nr:hypothetical protein A3770_01p08000 [Chloropicon primus]UPQ97493.1 hypothetical protein HOP50_01g07870 [Chloropicon primus]|eukprot:QDZ18282.1 hypothetical protein A3770_01p08000 [Chloropicon primus]